MHARLPVLLAILALCAFPCPARTIYVDDDAPNDPAPGNPLISDPAEDGSPDHPYDAIQEAINAATDGDVVLVMDGTYTGPGNRDIELRDKSITIRSENGPDTCVVDCQGSEADPHFGMVISGSPENSVMLGACRRTPVLGG